MPPRFTLHALSADTFQVADCRRWALDLDGAVAACVSHCAPAAAPVNPARTHREPVCAEEEPSEI
jgi:hypothetical protein